MGNAPASGIQKTTPLHKLSHVHAIGLKFGQQGNEVADLQRHLSALGYLPPHDGASLGNFDTATENALALFQWFHKLPESRILDVETARTMGVPRSCGVPDLLPSGFRALKNPWPKPNLQFAFSNLSTISPDINSSQKAAEAFKTGYALWEAVTPIRFSWSAAVTGSDIIIHFGPVTCPGDACTDWPNSHHQPIDLTHADSVFRDDVIWKVSNFNPHGDYDVVAFAAHEVGHALGLYFPENNRDWSHSPIDSALMYFQIPAGRRTLEPDDTAAAKRVYG
jgi:hypothetical protein